MRSLPISPHPSSPPLPLPLPFQIWDERARRNVMSMNCGHPVTAVCFSEDGITVYSGGLDNTIRQWDVRAAVGAEECTSTPGRAVMTLDGHMNTITGLALSPDGNSLLSNGRCLFSQFLSFPPSQALTGWSGMDCRGMDGGVFTE